MKDNNNKMSSFTRGSQIFMHSLRMAGQGIKTTSLLGGIVALSWLIFRASGKIQLTDLYYWVMVGFAHIKLSIGEIFYDRQAIIITSYDFILQQHRTMPALEFIQRIWQAPIGQRIMNFELWLFNNSIFEAIAAFFLSLSSSSIFFIIRGRKNMQKTKIRGAEIVSPQILAKMLRKEKVASDIHIADLPLVKNSERQHILVTGTTGSGKTNFLHELLPQIRARGDRAVIIDVNGTFVSSYYDEANDLLLNPYDSRSEHWLPWADCNYDYDYDTLASALVGSGSFSEPFWDETAKQVIISALKATKDHQSIDELQHIIKHTSSEEYSNFFAGSDAAAFTDKEAGKTMMSIRTHVANKIKPFVPLTNTSTPFSIRKHILEPKKDWLFISSIPTQREALKPLIACWFEIILNALMTRNPSEANANLWIIIDELPSLDKINSLKTALAESRKFGGCIVAGVQNIHQLIHLYGQSGALNLLDQFNSRFIFRVSDQEIARITSRMLGEYEMRESQESLSYGANTIRDGVNINTIEKKNQLVLPSEISTLRSLQCYVRLPGSWPITKLSMQYHNRNILSKHFITSVSEERLNSESKIAKEQSST